jgi:L-serine dehydratase
MRATRVLPGGLHVRRRAGALRRTLEATDDTKDPLRAMEWVTLYALAVNEENAAGGRVVTAPTKKRAVRAFLMAMSMLPRQARPSARTP